MGKDIPATGCKKAKRFWSKIWEQKDYYKKAEWMNNVEIELLILEECPKVEMYPNTLKQHFKKQQTRKPLAYMVRF